MMKITGTIKDFLHMNGKSYRITTDTDLSYQVAPRSDTSIFIGLMDGSHGYGVMQKGLEIHFSGINPFTGETTESPDEVIENILSLINHDPDGFIRIFNRAAKPARGKKPKFPKVAKNSFNELLKTG